MLLVLSSHLNLRHLTIELYGLLSMNEVVLSLTTKNSKLSEFIELLRICMYIIVLMRVWCGDGMAVYIRPISIYTVVACINIYI